MAKEITIAEYSQHVGVTKQAIDYRINNNMHLPGVASMRQVFNKIWLLKITRMPSTKEIENNFRKKK